MKVKPTGVEYASIIYVLRADDMIVLQLNLGRFGNK